MTVIDRNLLLHSRLEALLGDIDKLREGVAMALRAQPYANSTTEAAAREIEGSIACNINYRLPTLMDHANKDAK